MESVRTTPEPGARLVERVYGQLLEFIFQQHLRDGDPFPTEHEISRMTGASRPIVREALSQLRAGGLIEARRGARTCVRRPPDERAIHHLRSSQTRAELDRLEIRLALEPATARLAALVRDASQLQGLRHAATRADDAVLPFHHAVAAASGNPMFLGVLKALERDAPGQIAPDAPTPPSPEDVDRITSEHLAIVDAISRGDAETAEAAMRLHLLHARARALRRQE